VEEDFDEKACFPICCSLLSPSFNCGDRPNRSPIRRRSYPRCRRVQSLLREMQPSLTGQLRSAASFGFWIAEECQRACVRKICITDEVSDYVGGKESSLDYRWARILR
jgi:hypothetical protein